MFALSPGWANLFRQVEAEKRGSDVWNSPKCLVKAKDNCEGLAPSDAVRTTGV